VAPGKGFDDFIAGAGDLASWSGLLSGPQRGAKADGRSPRGQRPPTKTSSAACMRRPRTPSPPCFATSDAPAGRRRCCRRGRPRPGQWRRGRGGTEGAPSPTRGLAIWGWGLQQPLPLAAREHRVRARARGKGQAQKSSRSCRLKAG